MLQFCRKKKKKNSSEKLSLKELLESCFTIKISFIQTQVYHKSMTKSDVTQILSLLLISLLKVCITLLGKLQKCVKLQLFPYDKSSKVVDQQLNHAKCQGQSCGLFLTPGLVPQVSKSLHLVMCFTTWQAICYLCKVAVTKSTQKQEGYCSSQVWSKLEISTIKKAILQQPNTSIPLF